MAALESLKLDKRKSQAAPTVNRVNASYVCRQTIVFCRQPHTRVMPGQGTCRPILTLNLWRGSLLPLGSQAAPKQRLLNSPMGASSLATGYSSLVLTCHLPAFLSRRNFPGEAANSRNTAAANALWEL